MFGRLSQLITELRFKKHLFRPWEKNIFRDFLAETNNRLSAERNFILKQLLENSLLIKGEVAEFGVYKGGTALLMAEIIKNSKKNLMLFDTFCGTPKSLQKEFEKRKVHYKDVTLKSVQARFQGNPKVAFFEGKLPKSIPQEMPDLAFVHFHLNLYESTIKTLERIYPYISKDGIILFEDYGINECIGVKHAVDEFFRLKLKNLVYLPTGQAFYINRMDNE